MWLEKVIEAKKAKGLSAKTMSDRSSLHLTEQTIARILNRETKAPKIDTILDLGATVGLSAHQLFAETDLVPLDREEVDKLKNEIKELKAELEILRIKVKYQEEIIELHNRYSQVKSTE